MVLSFYIIQPIVENENRINDGNFKQNFSSFPSKFDYHSCYIPAMSLLGTDLHDKSLLCDTDLLLHIEPQPAQVQLQPSA